MKCFAMCLLSGPLANIPRVRHNKEGGTSMLSQSLQASASVTPLSIRLAPGVPPRAPLQRAATPRAARRRPVRQLCITLLAVLTLVGGLRTTAVAQSSGNFAADLDTEACTINTATGALTQHQLSTLTTTIQTPNASQTT